MVLSAKGTRLNRRGLQTRTQMIDVAIRCLAASRDGEPVSANLIARESGVTWGTVQHQFGDVDGLWASVLERVLGEWQPMQEPISAPETLETRIEVIVERFWRALASEEARAVGTLRMMLPGDRAEMETAYPLSANAIAAWDRAWTAAYESAFDGLDVDATKLSRVRIFLPGALRGLRAESEMSTYVDMDEGRLGIIDAIVAYLR